ncbi:MAG: hypothetical protein VR69_14805 [Peptococcaceae bacterium BRH_c4b]|nr:MAG: hypothetical protein VR69_14805 [Peptococcaceae bacterium BRH_c4b]
MNTRGARGTILFLALLTIILFVFFYRVVIYKEILMPSDFIIFHDPSYDSFNIPGKEHPGNSLIAGDNVYLYYPWRDFIKDSFNNGNLPLWNQYSHNGAPLLANHLSMVLEPINLIVTLLFEAKYVPGIASMTTMFLAAIFMFIYMRSIGSSFYVSLVCAISYAFSSYFIVWMWRHNVSVAMWIPLIMWSIEKIVTSKSYKYYLVLAISMGCQYLAGHLQTTIFVIILSSLYIIVRSRDEGCLKVNILVGFIFANFLGFMLAAVQLFPFIEYMLQSPTYEVGRGYGRENASLIEIVCKGLIGDLSYMKISLPTILTFLLPNFFGLPTDGTYWWKWNYSEQSAYAGFLTIPMFCFALIKLRNNKRVVFFLLCIIFSIGIMFALPVFNFINYLPIINKVATARLRIFYLFSLIVIFGYGLQYFLSNVKELDCYKYFCKIKTFCMIYLFFPLAIILLYLIINYEIIDKTAHYLHRISYFYLIFPMVSLFVFILLTSIYRKNLLNLNLYKIFLLLLIISDLFVFGYKYNPTIKQEYFYPKNELVNYLSQDKDVYRISVKGMYTFRPNLNMAYNIQSSDGSDALTIRRYAEFVNIINKNTSLEQFSISPKRYDNELVDLMGIKYIIINYQEEPGKYGLESTKFEEIRLRNVRVYKNRDALDKAFFVPVIKQMQSKNEILSYLESDSFKARNIGLVEGNLEDSVFDVNDAKAKVVGEGGNKIIVTTSNKNDGYLVVTDTYYNGWNVYIDGRKTNLYPTDYAFKGTFIPKGEHTVIFSYEPMSYGYGLYASLISFIILLILFFKLCIRRKELENEID